jgi:two-component sensor histidine kinase
LLCGSQDAVVDHFIDLVEDARQQQELLVGELTHRVKNILAVISSVARQTFGVGWKGQDVFGARLAAMGNAFELLGRGEGRSAELYDLGVGATKSFDDGSRYEISGEHRQVDAKSALAVSMTVSVR